MLAILPGTECLDRLTGSGLYTTGHTHADEFLLRPSCRSCPTATLTLLCFFLLLPGLL